MSTISKHSVENFSTSSIVRFGVSGKVKHPKGEGSEGLEADLETWVAASTLLEEEYEVMNELHCTTWKMWQGLG